MVLVLEVRIPLGVRISKGRAVKSQKKWMALLRQNLGENQRTASIQVLVGMTWTKPKVDRKRKARPSYWRIIQLLRKLRVQYREHNKEEPGFYITLDDFGIVFRFNKRHALASYNGWDIFDVDMDTYEGNPLDFGRNLMWVLIDKGYMSYLRDPENGNTKVFRHFLINEGWAEKIFDRRLEEYNNEPKNRFRIEQITRLRKLPLHYVIMHYPSMFDYSW